MKTKEIVTLVVALVVIVVAFYFGYNMLFPSNTAQNQEQTKAEEVIRISPEIDENTYKSVEGLSDYGQPALEGLGKSDLFK